MIEVEINVIEKNTKILKKNKQENTLDVLNIIGLAVGLAVSEVVGRLNARKNLLIIKIFIGEGFYNLKQVLFRLI